ncbi:unnamed protein product [Urochloa humidicola]
MAMRAAGVLRARPAAASVAATCCRSISSFSREELKELEEDMESRVRARMEQRFDARVREIVRSEARKILAGEVAKINQETSKHWRVGNLGFGRGTLNFNSLFF